MRIIAVTSDANLAVGLSLRCRDDVDVEVVRGVADLEARRDERFDVALISLETASRGILAAGVIREHIDEIPCVVVANTPPAELPVGVRTLEPPFDLDAVTDELQQAVDDAESGVVHTATAPAERVPIQRPELDRRSSAMRASASPVAPPTAPPSNGRPVAAPPAVPDEPQTRPSEPQRQPAARAVPDEPQTRPSEPERQPAARAVPDQAPTSPSEPQRQPAVRAVPEPDPDPELAADEAPDLEPSPDDSGWSRRERLDRGLVAANELQRLVDDMPQLNDRHAIADALVHEVTDSIEGAAAVLWGPDGTGGYEVLAWHGVPSAISGRRVSGDQPLLRDAIEDHAVFLPPDERRPGYLEGLPGLHGGTVMAAVLRADEEMHGVVVVSGGSPSEEDLIGVCALADEHAMAIAIGAHLELLRSRTAVDHRERWRGRLLG